jgi:hypothetical protein
MPPQPPAPGLAIASALEIAMLAVFAYHHSWTGLALGAAYAWFSATWSFAARLIRGD